MLSMTEKVFHFPKLGLNMKIHLSNNAILDFTTLPDFGQIESDPANLNFTSYDTYFDEKRKFFLDNINSPLTDTSFTEFNFSNKLLGIFKYGNKCDISCP